MGGLGGKEGKEEGGREGEGGRGGEGGEGGELKRMRAQQLDWPRGESTGDPTSSVGADPACKHCVRSSSSPLTTDGSTRRSTRRFQFDSAVSRSPPLVASCSSFASSVSSAASVRPSAPAAASRIAACAAAPASVATDQGLPGEMAPEMRSDDVTTPSPVSSDLMDCGSEAANARLPSCASSVSMMYAFSWSCIKQLRDIGDQHTRLSADGSYGSCIN